MRFLNKFILLVMLLSVAVSSMASVPYSSVPAFNIGPNGTVPVCTSMLFRPAAIGLVNYRLAECPITRGTTYYFSQSGNDSTGNGTSGNPWKTIAKANSVLNPSTTLSAAFTLPGTGVVSVASTAGFPTTPSTIYVAGIAVNYTGISGNTFTGCTGTAGTYGGATNYPVIYAGNSLGNTALLFKRGDVWKNETTTYTFQLSGGAPATGQANMVFSPIPAAYPMIGDTVTLTGGTTETLTVAAVNNVSTTQAMTITFASNIANAGHTSATWTGLSSLWITQPNVTIGAWGTNGRKPIFSAFSTTRYYNVSVSNSAVRGDSYNKTSSIAETNNVAYLCEDGDVNNPWRKLASIAQVDSSPGTWFQPQTYLTATASLSTSGSTVTVNSTAGFPAGPATIIIGKQSVTYQSIGSSTTFSTCTIASGNYSFIANTMVNGTTIYFHDHDDYTSLSSNGSASNGRNYYPLYANDAHAIFIEDVNGTRVDGISIRGYGGKPIIDSAGNTRAYGIRGQINGTNCAVISNTDAWFDDNHCIGVLGSSYSANPAYFPNPGGSSLGGGIVTYYRCKAGWGTTNDTPFVMYNPAGGQEAICWECESPGTTIPIGIQTGNSPNPYIEHCSNIVFNNIGTLTGNTATVSVAGGYANTPFLPGDTISFTGGTGTDNMVVSSVNTSTGVITFTGNFAYTGHTGQTWTNASGSISGVVPTYCPALCLNWGNRNIPNQYMQYTNWGSAAIPPSWTDLKNCRAWAVGEIYKVRPRTPLDINTRTVALTTGSQTAYSAQYSITGSPSSGTYTLTYNGQVTGAIAYNAASSAIQTACQSGWNGTGKSIGANITVSGSYPGPYTILIGANNPAFTITAQNSIVGGAVSAITTVLPTVTVTNPSDLGTQATAGFYASQWGQLTGGASGAAAETIYISAVNNSTGVVTLGSNPGGSNTSNARTELQLAIGDNAALMFLNPCTFSPSTAYINCQYDGTWPWGASGGANLCNSGSVPNASTVFINDTFVYDFTQISDSQNNGVKRSGWLYSAGASAPYWYNCRWHIKTYGRDLGTIESNMAATNYFTVVISGTPTGGNYVITLAGQSATIAAGTATATILSTLQTAWASVVTTPANMTISGSATNFTVSLGAGNTPNWTGLSISNSFSGGSNPTATIATFGNFHVFNSIISGEAPVDSTTGTVAGIGNNPLNQINNAYASLLTRSGVSGYDQDPYLIELYDSPSFGHPEPGSPLLSSNTQLIFGTYRLEYDADWVPRAFTTTAIGPYEPITYVRQSQRGRN